MPSPRSHIVDTDPWPRRVTTAVAAYAIAGGAITLAGWVTETPRLTDWPNTGISMFPNTAVCAIACGAALVLRRVSGEWRAVGRLLAMLAASIGALTLVEHLTGVNPGLDTLLFDRPWGQAAAAAPMRMGPPASASFVMIGMALLLLDGDDTRRASVVLGLATIAVAMLSLIGHLYGAQEMYALPHLTAIALQTASIICAIGIGLVASVPEREPMRALLERSAAGMLARRAFPVVVVIAVTLGWIRVSMQNAGLVDTAMGTSLRTLAEIALLGGVLWWAIAMVRTHEQALRAKEAELKTIVDGTPFLLTRCTRDLRYKFVSAGYAKMMGRTPEEIVGRRIVDVMGAEGFATILPHIEEVLRGDVVEYESAVHISGVGPRQLSVVYTPETDADGAVCGWIASIVDITERMRAEEMRALLAASIEASDDAIVSKNLDGLILSWNGGAERLFGYSAAEAIGRPIDLIIPSELRDEERAILERLRRGERVTQYETVRVAKDGRRIDVSLTVSPVRDTSGRIVGAAKVARDLADRKRTEQALTEAARRKDEFLAMLAHELRNPLTPLRNGLELLRMRGDDTSTVGAIRAMMERQLRHIVRLVDDLLDASRITRDKLELRIERVDLAGIVNEVVEANRPQIDAATLALDVILPSDAITLDGDSTRLTQVFGNILANAVKYSDAGGRISIEVAREGVTAVVAIRDTGRGIPPEMLTGIFEMFAQVDHSSDVARRGLGIGLALAKRLVELHGGTVTAHSDGVGRGTELVVRLPTVVETAQAHASG